MPLYYSGSGAGGSSVNFHAVRRTKDGLLYYTTVKSTDNEVINNQTSNDPNNVLPVNEYVNEEVFVQPATYTFTGNGVLTDFTLAVSIFTDDTYVWINGVLQERERDYFVEGNILKFRVPPFNGSQIAVRFASRRYFNNDNDKYQQYRIEEGRVFYYIDDEGYFVKRLGAYDSSNTLDGSGANAYELYDDEALRNITSWKEDISTGFDQTDLTMDTSGVTMDKI